MTQDKPATIILDESLMRTRPSLMELEALAAKAVALLACRAEAISATIFCKPREIPEARSRNSSVNWKESKQTYWISVMDAKRNIRGLYELKPQAPVVDFEVVNKAVSDLVC